MLWKKLIKLALVLLPLSLAVVIVAAQDDADVQARIESAMSAAPADISADATVLDFNADGELVELKAGTNAWTCYPDGPVSPGNDPMCLDSTFQKWFEALLAGAEFETASPGLAYMLQGGSDASNTDPFLAEPLEGDDWVSTPPHIMVLFPDPIDTELFSTDHDSGEPYVMWAGTEYEHIMMAVEDHEH